MLSNWQGHLQHLPTSTRPLAIRIQLNSFKEFDEDNPSKAFRLEMTVLKEQIEAGATTFELMETQADIFSRHFGPVRAFTDKPPKPTTTAPPKPTTTVQEISEEPPGLPWNAFTAWKKGEMDKEPKGEPKVMGTQTLAATSNMAGNLGCQGHHCFSGGKNQTHLAPVAMSCIIDKFKHTCLPLSPNHFQTLTPHILT